MEEGTMLEKDAIFSKISIIKNCLNTIKTVTNFETGKLDEFIAQDVFVLNLQRSVQSCIDMANIIISVKGFKLPATYKESFHILLQNEIIDRHICEKMVKLVGFRNIAVHDYQEIEVEILKSILKNDLKDFEEFYTVVYKYIENDKDF